MDRVREELERLLSAKQFILSDKKLYVWGTGNTALLYSEGFKRLEEDGSVIEGYCDNNPAKWGGVCNGKKIVSPKYLQDLSDVYVLICSPQPQIVVSVSSQLEDMHIKYAHIDEWIFITHKEQVLAAYDLLDDDESRSIYKELIRCRMKGEYPNEQIVRSDQYYALPKFAQRNPKEVFVDCGAFVGDTIEKYIWERDGVFTKIIGFEPDMYNYKAMECRIDRLKREWNIRNESIVTYPYGVGDISMSAMVEKNEEIHGLSSKLNQAVHGETINKENSQACRIIALDEELSEQISFLKADIEGYEYKMLLGARKTIIKDKPLLAVCIYHNGVDMYSIPLLLQSMVTEYRMAIRHHSYVVDETVLYAWVDGAK